MLAVPWPSLLPSRKLSCVHPEYISCLPSNHLVVQHSTVRKTEIPASAAAVEGNGQAFACYHIKVLGLNLEWDGIRREATLRTRERKEAAIGTPMMGHIRTGRMRRKCLDRAQMRAAGHRCPQWRRPAEESLVKRRPRHQGWKDLCPRSFGQDKCHVAVSLCALMPLWSHHFNIANCPHPRSGSVSLMSPCYCLWGSIDLLSKIYTSEIMYMLF